MFECKLCEDSHERFKTIEGLYSHLERKHNDEIPPDWSVEQFAYYLKTGKKHGTCVICKGKTKFNPKTGKYYRLCENPKCKEKNREIFEKRMIGKYGKVSLLDDPEQQKKMLANRSISGEYTWSDGTKKTYTGSYEYDFLRFLDVLMDYPSRDVIAPSPHTYYYEYEGKKHFYIPDVYIESLNLEIEIKDGGDNPNTHHKIQNVDKVKERLKDQVLLSQTSVSYIKITNKSYDTFMKYLMELKDQYNKLDRREKFTPIFILAENYNEEILGEIVTEADENTDYTDGVSDETEMNTGNDSSSVYYACDTTGLKTIKPTKDANGNECIYASPFKEYAATKGLKLNNSQLSISSKVGEEISMNVKLLDKEANVDRVFSVYELNGDGFTPVTTNGKESKTVYMKKGHAEVIREFKIKNYRKYIKRFPNVKCEDFPTDKQIKEKETAKESVNIENTLEATNLSYSNSFEDVKEIVDSLSKKDLNKICNGTFKKSPNTIYREVILRNGEPAAFIEVYNLKTEYPDADGCIVVAVKEKYRGMGLTKKLVHRMLEDKKFKWTHLIWETAKTNKASIAIANQLKFKKTSTNEENIEFSIYRTKKNTKESFDTLDAILYSHRLAQGMRDATSEEQQSVMENIKNISEETGVNFYDEVEESAKKNDLHGISPNKKFYILPFFEMMNPKNWGQSPMYNGKFKEARPRIMKKISWCKSQDDIKYLLRDASYGINQLTKLRNDLDYALKNPDDNKSKYVELRKRNKKGLTVQSIDEHIKWIKEEYRPAIYAKKEELAGVKESIEMVEESSKVLDIYKKTLLNKPVYHGSIDYYDTLEPTGLDFGNKLEEPGWSLYTWKNKNDAYGWVTFQIIKRIQRMLNLDFKMFCLNSYKAVISESGRKMLENAFSSNMVTDDMVTGYVYTVIIRDNMDIGLGHSSNTKDCVTIHSPHIKPDRIEKIIMTYGDIINFIGVIDDENFATVARSPKSSGINHRGIASFLMTNDLMWQFMTNKETVKAIKTAISNGELKEGESIEDYMNEHNLTLEKINFLKRIKLMLPTKESSETVEEGSKAVVKENDKKIHEDNLHLEKEYGILVNGKYQPIAQVKGYNFRCRGRSELLVIKGDSVYLAKGKEGLYGNYTVPGGGWDEKEPHDVSAIREAEEEARLSTKNVQYGGNYLTEYSEPHKWVQEKIPKKDQWRGYYTEVYIGEYTGKFNGHIDEEDKDDIINVGKFYPISEVRGILNPVHRRIIDAYIQQRDMMKKAPSHLYRVTYEDDGIYEAFRKNATFEEWKAFKESNAAKWLPIPSKYGDSDVSYFTEEGFKKFRELTLPLFETKLDTDRIIANKIKVPEGTITYHDKYQYVISPEKAMESLELVEEEAHYSSADKYPVFIVLMHAGTSIANAIKAFTHDDFSHACISFNSRLDPLYSFGRKKLDASDSGFVINNPKAEFFTKFHSYYSVYVMYVNKKAIDLMKQRLEYFIENEDNLKFDNLNMIGCGLGISSEKSKKYFCSRFCMEIIGQGVELEKVPSLYKPQDMSELDNISLVNKGADFYNYDYKETERNLKKIKKGSKNHE